MSSEVIDLCDDSSRDTTTLATPSASTIYRSDINDNNRDGDDDSSSSDEVEEVEPEWYPLVDLSGDTHRYVKIVGIRYYGGVAHPGEYVTLVREPHNPYDCNAIRVDNMGGEKVGHVKRELAAVLSPLAARLGSALKLDGTIPGPGNHYELPLRLRIYGATPSDVGGVAKAFERLAFNAKAAAKAAAGVAAASTTVGVRTRTLDWREQQKQLDEIFEGHQKERLARLPDVVMPACVTSELLEHQLMGVRWLVGRERNCDLPFWNQVKEGKSTKWFCEVTRSSQMQAPAPVQGAILADDMGLGKTLQTLALILANPPPGRDYSAPVATAPEPGDRKPTAAGAKKKQRKTLAQSASAEQSDTAPTTLIVCPVSVMSNWQDQIRVHIALHTLRMAVYYGADRHDLVDRACDYDVLIASYNTLQYDFVPPSKTPGNGNDAQTGTAVSSRPAKRVKGSSSIFDVPFYRVVLDEAHTVRNSNSRTFQAVAALRARHRLCLTGTPLQNKPDDIQSLFRFLKVEPFAQRDVFRRSISQPIRDGDQGADAGLALLRALMGHFALRRHKSGVNLDLPPKTVQLRLVEYPDVCPHGRIHQTLYESAKAALRASISNSTNPALSLSAHSASVFEILMRLRQACCSGRLVPAERLQRAEQVLAEIQSSDDALTPEKAVKLLDKLKGALQESGAAGEGDDDDDAGVPPECAICMESMGEDSVVVLRNCGHVFCQACLTRVAASTDCYGDRANKCPFCRQTFAQSDMIPWMAASQAATQAQDDPDLAWSERMDELGPSPKMQALLQSMAEMQPGEKGVIFSQFTKFLDEIGTFLEGQGKAFIRIDGSMSTTRRSQAMQTFSSDADQGGSGPEFILCSLHAAGTGINLTRANHVFLMDTWWNGSVENQAFDRVHRIGQTRPVRVVRFVAADSIESRMVDLQEQKALTAKGVFESLSAEDKKKARFGDIKRLLEL